MTLAARGLAGSTVTVERFFRPAGEPPTTLDSGFLPDPEGPFGRMMCPHVRRSSELDGPGCLVILGEPGIGKSTAMAERRRRFAGSIKFYDLRYVPSDDVLRSKELQNWRREGLSLHLILDSVDEASSADFPRMFVGALEGGPLENLRLEIACRAGEWPRVLDETLPALFGKDLLRSFHVEPLRRKDIAEIAGALDLASDDFLRVVDERNLAPLASIPLTLELLLTVFRARGTLPQQAVDLYEDACLLLCRGNSQTRTTPCPIDPALCLDVASSIGAATIFSRRTAICQQSRSLEAANEVSVDRLLTVLASNVVTAERVDEALATGLFSRCAPRTYMFYHQTFAEYMAARWMCAGQLSLTQKRQLLFHSEDNERLVVQLSGVATWLACRDAEFLELLARFAPERFIYVDSNLATDGQRDTAVRALLERVQDLTVATVWWDDAASRRLGHPGLALQLKRYILDTGLSELTRKRAMAIAAANRLSELTEMLCSIALDTGVDLSVRCEASEAAFDSASNRQFVAERLCCLAEAEDPSDPREELRGTVLEQLWPHHLTPKDLFRLLTRPRTANYSGRYQQFAFRVVDGLAREHVRDGLKWAGENARRHDGVDDCFAFERLSAALCRKAWEFLEEVEIRRDLAGVVLRILRCYRAVFCGPAEQFDAATLLADLQKRKWLLEGIAELSDDPVSDISRLQSPYEQPPFVVEADVEWALAAWRDSTDRTRHFWAELVKSLLARRSDDRMLSLVVEEVGDAVSSPLLPFPRVVEIDSNEADIARRSHRESLAYVSASEARAADRERKLAEGASVDIDYHVARAAEGDLGEWWKLIHRLRKGVSYQEAGSLKPLLNWEAGPHERRELCVGVAQSYLTTLSADEDWQARYRVSEYRPAIAGCLSLHFVFDVAPTWAEENVLILARQWVAAMLDFGEHDLAKEADRESHRALLTRLIEYAPEQVQVAVRTILDRELRRPRDLTFLRVLSRDDAIGAIVEESMLTRRMQMDSFQSLLEELVRIAPQRGFRLARQVLRHGWKPPWLPPPCSVWRRNDRHSRRRARRVLGQSRRHSESQLRIVITLLKVPIPEAWHVAWAACGRFPELARLAFSRHTDRSVPQSWGGHVPAVDLADLYYWLEMHLPVVTLADVNYFWIPTLEFRRSLLSELAGRLTPKRRKRSRT